MTGGLAGLLARAAERVAVESGRSANGYILHVSDLATCPARALNAILGTPVAWLDEKRRLYSEYSALLGRVFHQAVAALAPADVKTEVPVSVPVEEAGLRGYIYGRADLVVRASVVEVKTSLTTSPDNPKLQRYLLQAGFYAAALGLRKAIVLVFHRVKPECRYYMIQGPAVEKTYRVIVERARMVLRALAARGEARDELGLEASTPGPWCEYCQYYRSCPFKNKLYKPETVVEPDAIVRGEC